MGITKNISKEVKQLNEMLLSVSWKEADLSACFFHNGYSQLTKEQNDLIKIILLHIPEWKRLIGCKQHSFHDYTLDIHTLLVLKNLQNHRYYEKLEENNKLTLIYSALLHDIEKNENELDPEHPVKGAGKSGAILYRLGFEEEFINNVYLLIKSHQVFGFLISGKVTLTDDELYNLFKKPIIADLQTILSTADIKSVKKDGTFYKEGWDENFDVLKEKIKKIVSEKENRYT